MLCAVDYFQTQQMCHAEHFRFQSSFTESCRVLWIHFHCGNCRIAIVKAVHQHSVSLLVCVHTTVVHSCHVLSPMKWMATSIATIRSLVYAFLPASTCKKIVGCLNDCELSFSMDLAMGKSKLIGFSNALNLVTLPFTR